MSLTVTQGIVNAIDDDQSGTFIALNGSVLDYDDSTIPDRDIVLSIGDLVIGRYNTVGTKLENVVPLESLNNTVNNTLTADSFTAAKVKCQLQIAQCCAVKKINKYITDQKDGKRCEKDFDDAELMFNLIDSLRGFIPEGDLISGQQATYEMIVAYPIPPP